ncbi:hypothetical protein NXW50_10575 [Bacteroides thetaiotaomicron]|nr:hypothetical protein [Bacteroides thetaiotaomicron]MCS2278622.1 hypothetical protein [Bacteroides thetaiotaomicron]
MKHCPVRGIACLPQVVHDVNAASSIYVQCHICCTTILHDGIHCIRAMQYGDTLNPILHECNAPYMAMPIGNRYYTGAIWYAMYSCKPANNASLPYTNGCIAV